jgi:hypothetical protein
MIQQRRGTHDDDSRAGFMTRLTERGEGLGADPPLSGTGTDLIGSSGSSGNATALARLSERAEQSLAGFDSILDRSLSRDSDVWVRSSEQVGAQ